jgi:TPP-dependent pyruvate/acetoin dehydrogenase alpha subunit
MSTEHGDAGQYDYSTRPVRPPKPNGDPNLEIDDTTRRRLYTRLQELRQLEKRAYDLFMQNLVKGTSHLSLGMEAVSAGFGEAMRHDDYVFATYRGHAHTLSKGASMEGVLAELLGRANGLMGGKGGSMHLSDAARGMMGSYAIIGAHLPLANGTAWSAQMRGSGQVTVCFFGDGTTNIGAFHEALNFAAVWNLPVVFVCENNLYMEYTPIDHITAVPRPAADRACAYGLEPIVIDGNDVDVVYDTATAVLDKARRGDGPSLVEALTYRSGGHSRADPGKYRPPEEVAAWADHDPAVVYHQRLLERGVPELELTQISNDVARRVDAATEAAKAGPPPDLDSIFTEVWADGGWSWRN